MKKYLLLTFLSLYGVAANAVENTITVLGVVHPSANSVRATELLQRVAISWPTSTGTTITLANGGGLVSLTFATSGTDNDQRTAAINAANALNLRNLYAADVILFFTTSMVDDKGAAICGLAGQENWTAQGGTPGVFDDPDGDGVDLAGAEDSYVAIMATTDCLNHSTLSLHEFGHLFGAGHEDTGLNHTYYLYADSHAYLLYLPPPYPTIRSNLHNQYTTGYNWYQYSDYSGVGNNMAALNRTALSVANYRRLTSVPPTPPDAPPPVGGCSLSTPVNMTGHLLNYCDPYPWSHYIVSWGDACPSQSDYYQVWKEQPVGSGYVPGWTVPGPVSDVYVAVQDGNVRVQACNSSTCSALSSSIVFVHSGC